MNLLSVPQAARKARKRIETVYGWVHRRELPVIKYGQRGTYIEESDLEKFLRTKYGVPAKPEKLVDIPKPA